MSQKQSIKKKLFNIAKIILSLAMLVFVLYKIDRQELVQVFKNIHFIWLIPAFLLFVLSKFFSALRLNRLLRCISIRISDLLNIKLYLFGMFYNLFLPGGIGGDAYKIYLLKKNFEVKTKNVFWSIVIDRVFGLAALYFLAAILAWFTVLPSIWKTLFLISIPLGLLAFYLMISYLFKTFKLFFGKALGFSFGVQLAQFACAWFLLKAIQQPDQTTEYLFVFLISSIVAAFPITIGGMGSRELTFFYGAQLLGLDISSSIAISLLFYLITAAVSLVGIYYGINTKKITAHFEENQQPVHA